MMAVIALLLAGAEPAMPDASRPRVHVTARIEPDVALDAADFSEIASGVRRIWQGHVDVRVASTADAAAPLADDQLELVVTNRTLPGDDGVSLGWIAFVNGQPQPTLTVSMAAVARLMRSGTWRGRPFASLPPIATREFIRRALTHAVAHELGHYLLRSKVHGRSGLMRASLAIDDLMERRDAVDTIDPADVARLRLYAPAFARAGSEADAAQGR